MAALLRRFAGSGSGWAGRTVLLVAPAVVAAASCSPTMTPPAVSTEQLRAMRTSIRQPVDGASVTTNALTVRVATDGFKLDCRWGDDVEGHGHYHLRLDSYLVDSYCESPTVLSLQNLAPGLHRLEVIPASGAHTESTENRHVLSFDYKPAEPLPLVRGRVRAGTPSVEITFPESNEPVSGSFEVVLDVRDFQLNCDLFGKDPVAGYGHWRLTARPDSRPAEEPPRTLGFGCGSVARLDAALLATWQVTTLTATLVDNRHVPLQPPSSHTIKLVPTDSPFG